MITDVVMPQMNGRELARRAASLCPKMKIVFMSGYTDNVIAHHGVLEAGLALLEKPLTPEAVLRKVRGALDA
jgi:FixJ family two-component response regulator